MLFDPALERPPQRRPDDRRHTHPQDLAPEFVVVGRRELEGEVPALRPLNSTRTSSRRRSNAPSTTPSRSAGNSGGGPAPARSASSCRTANFRTPNFTGATSSTRLILRSPTPSIAARSSSRRSGAPNQTGINFLRINFITHSGGSTTPSTKMLLPSPRKLHKTNELTNMDNLDGLITSGRAPLPRRHRHHHHQKQTAPEAS